MSASSQTAIDQISKDFAARQAGGPAGPTPEDITAQKQAALAPVERAITGEQGGLPAPPAPAQLPAAPKPIVDPDDYSKLSAALVGIAMIAGAKSGNWLAAASSLNGALQGHLEGNQDKADREWQKYQADYDKAVEQHREQQQEYLDVLNNKRLSINQKFDQWRMIASKYDDQQMLALARQKHYDAVTAAIMSKDEHIATLSVSKEKVDNALNKTRDAQGNLTSEAIGSIAEQMEAGDTTAILGLSKQDKEKVRNRMADDAQIRGTTGADQAARNANFVGVKAGERTLGTRQANIDSAVTEAQKILPILRAASDAVPRSKVTSLNQLIQIAERGTSDTALLRLAQAARSFANIYTRAVVPGASGVTDREESIKNLPTFTDQASFNGVLDIMDQEMQAAKESPAAVREDMARAITGRKPQENAEVPSRHPPDIQSILDKYK